MTAIPTGLSIKSATASERTTPRGFRLALAGLFAQSGPGIAVGGRLAAPADGNGGPLEVRAHATLMKYQINAGVIVIPRTGQGVYVVANPAVLVIDTAAANATYPRIDWIYIAQPDPELSDTGVARVDVISGPATAAVPVAPSLPAGAYLLASKVIAAGATNTNDGAAFTSVPGITTLNAAIADGAIGTSQLAAGSVTNAKINDVAPTKISAGTIPSTVATAGNHTGKLQGADYYLQTADPGANTVAAGSLWDSWTP